MRIVDFHNHMIPGVDDGAQDVQQGLAALGAMLAQGITTVITTPHFRASSLNNPLEFERRIKPIDVAWDRLAAAAKDTLPGLVLLRGVELALDEPLSAALDERLRLAGTTFTLVEFPYFSVPPNSPAVLAQVRRLGLKPILAHPERYQDIDADLGLLMTWKRTGAFLQLNAGSLVGIYGSRVESTAWRLLRHGLVDYISSDYHASGECATAAARRLMRDRGAESQFQFLASLNGERLLTGADPSPVAPVADRPGWWTRWRRSLRHTK